jgi:hypothetical protein
MIALLFTGACSVEAERIRSRVGGLMPYTTPAPGHPFLFFPLTRIVASQEGLESLSEGVGEKRSIAVYLKGYAPSGKR